MGRGCCSPDAGRGEGLHPHTPGAGRDEEAPERPDCAERMASAHSANSAEALRSLSERLRRPCPSSGPHTYAVAPHCHASFEATGPSCGDDCREQSVRLRLQTVQWRGSRVKARLCGQKAQLIGA